MSDSLGDHLVVRALQSPKNSLKMGSGKFYSVKAMSFHKEDLGCETSPPGDF